MQVTIAGISVMSMEWSNDGFGVLCDRCQEETSVNRLSGDLPPGIPGHYCDSCYREVCKEASEYYQERFRESAKHLEATVLSRKDGGWSPGEILGITSSVGRDVWSHSEHPKHLVIRGHCAEGVFRALPRSLRYKVEQVVGTEKLPFLPL